MNTVEIVILWSLCIASFIDFWLICILFGWIQRIRKSIWAIYECIEELSDGEKEKEVTE